VVDVVSSVSEVSGGSGVLPGESFVGEDMVGGFSVVRVVHYLFGEQVGCR